MVYCYESSIFLRVRCPMGPGCETCLREKVNTKQEDEDRVECERRLANASHQAFSYVNRRHLDRPLD